VSRQKGAAGQGYLVDFYSIKDESRSFDVKISDLDSCMADAGLIQLL